MRAMMEAGVAHATWDRLDSMQRSHGFYGGVAQESVSEHRELLALLGQSAELEDIERFCRNHMLRVLEAYLASTDYAPRA